MKCWSKKIFSCNFCLFWTRWIRFCYYLHLKTNIYGDAASNLLIDKTPKLTTWACKMYVTSIIHNRLLYNLILVYMEWKTLHWHNRPSLGLKNNTSISNIFICIIKLNSIHRKCPSTSLFNGGFPSEPRRFSISVR